MRSPSSSGALATSAMRSNSVAPRGCDTNVSHTNPPSSALVATKRPPGMPANTTPLSDAIAPRLRNTKGGLVRCCNQRRLPSALVQANHAAVDGAYDNDIADRLAAQPKYRSTLRCATFVCRRSQVKRLRLCACRNKRHLYRRLRRRKVLPSREAP